MITEIKIFSRQHMNGFAESGGLNFPYCNKLWNLISIYSEDKEYLTNQTKNTLNEIGMRRFLSLDFWDLTNDNTYEKVKIRYPDAKLFDQKHATKIIKFLDIIQEEKEESILVVHCSAGISRSGAVGTFANDYCGLDYSELIKTNCNIMANQYVLRTLRKTAGMTPDFGSNNGISPVEKGIIINPF